MTRVIEEERRAAGFVRNRAKAYKLSFGSPAGQEVLADLAKFCRASQSCFHADPRVHAALEGRREVWLRIQQHLNLQPDQLYQLFTGRTLTTILPEETDQ